MGHFNAPVMRFTIFIILCLYFSVLNAQTSTYHAFPESGGIWRVDWGEQSCFSSGLPQANYRYIMNGDTNISSKWYHKIEREFGSSMVCGPFYPQGSGFMGGLREDSLSKQIYFVPRDSIDEILLYDFNLSIGDTLPRFIFDLFNASDITIANIDSILIGSDYRKVFRSNNNEIVEGIGSLAGLFEVQRLDLTPQLICFIRDSIELYQYATSVNCELVTAVDDSPNRKEVVHLFPNPFISTCTIYAESQSTLILYNFLGIEIKRINCLEGNNVFEREELASGLYFYELNNSKSKHTGRILIN